MHSTFQKGKLAELKVQEKAVELGWVPCLPIMEQRYDMLLEKGGRILRAQVKWCDFIKGGSVRLSLNRETRRNGHSRPYDAEDVDVLLIYVPETGDILWVEPDVFSGKKTLNFRLEPPAKKQRFRHPLRYAKDFVWAQ